VVVGLSLQEKKVFGELFPRKTFNGSSLSLILGRTMVEKIGVSNFSESQRRAVISKRFKVLEIIR